MALGTIQPSVYSCLLRMNPGRTVSEVLGILADSQIPSGVQPDLVAKVLRKNQAFEHLIRKLDILSRMDAEWTGLEAGGGAEDQEITSRRILRLLGSNGSRNAILIIRMQMILGTGIPKKEGEPLTLDLQGRLKNAQAIEELWQEKRWTNSFYAFLGGLHYDWLAVSLESCKLKAPALKTCLEDTWKTYLKVAQVAQLLSGLPKNFKLQPYAVAGSLLMGLGKVLMMVNHPAGGAGPSWIDFHKEVLKYKITDPLVRTLMERSRFPLAYTEFSALAVGYFGFFPPLVPTLMNVSEPYLLRGVSEDQYLLALILAASEEVVLGSEMGVFGVGDFTKNRLSRVGIGEPEFTAQAAKVLRT